MLPVRSAQARLFELLQKPNAVLSLNHDASEFTKQFLAKKVIGHATVRETGLLVCYIYCFDESRVWAG